MFEAYTVAVRVSLINGTVNGLMNISRGFAKAHGDAQALQRTIDSIKFRLLAGGALAGTGLFGLHLIGKTLPFAKEYSRQLALMNTLGMKQAEIAKVVGDAWRTSYQVPTSTAAQNLASFRELRSAFGSDTLGQMHASQMLPVVARLQGVMQSLTGKPQEHVGFDMVKAIELRTGVMTTEALQRNADLMSKAIIGMGGTISVSDFHGALKMGKIATNKLSDDFTYNYLPTLMQELKTSGGGGTRGAQSAGTILMSLYQQMHGRMTKAAMPLWVQAGLVNSADVVKTSTGQYQVKPGAVAGTKLFEQNPFLWVQQFLRPAVDRLSAARGISPETAINAMFSNRNAAFGAYNMYFKAAQYERDKATITKADGGYAAYQKLLRTDPTLAGQALAAQWHNILAQIGFSIMPTLVSGTLKLMNALRGMGQWMHEHPSMVKTLTLTFVGLSAAMAFGGMVILLSAAFSAIGLLVPVLAAGFAGVAAVVGPVVAGIAGLAGAMVPFGTVMIPAIAAIGGIVGGVLLFAGAVAGLGVAIYEIVKHWDASKGILWNVKHELSMFYAWLLKQAVDLLNKIPGVHIAQPGSVPPHKKSFGDIVGEALSPGSSNLGSRFVAPKLPATKSAYTTGVYIDGKLVGHAVMPHMADALDRSANTGANAFDPGMALAPVGSRYA